MEYLGFELCSDEELMEYYMGGLQKECDKRNMTIELCINYGPKM